MENKILLLLGTSGVGKSTLINSLCKMYGVFYKYARPYTTRPLRPHETNKINILERDFIDLVKKGDIIFPNFIYGNYYGPSLLEIKSIMLDRKMPVLDWPVDKVNSFKQAINDTYVKTIYLLPPNLKSLRERLTKDDRDPKEERYKAAKKELFMFSKGYYNRVIDFILVNKGDIEQMTKKLNTIIRQVFKEV